MFAETEREHAVKLLSQQTSTCTKSTEGGALFLLTWQECNVQCVCLTVSRSFSS